MWKQKIMKVKVVKVPVQDGFPAMCIKDMYDTLNSMLQMAYNLADRMQHDINCPTALEKLAVKTELLMYDIVHDPVLSECIHEWYEAERKMDWDKLNNKEI